MAPVELFEELWITCCGEGPAPYPFQSVSPFHSRDRVNPAARPSVAVYVPVHVSRRGATAHA